MTLHLHPLMKTLCPLFAVLFLSSLVSAALTPSISVRAIVKSDHESSKGKSAEEAMTKSLEISIRGSHEVNGSVDVVCTFYAHDLDSGDEMVEERQQLKATLEAGQEAVLSSKAVTFKHTPEHAEKKSSSGNGSGLRPGGKNRSTYRKVAATGHRYHGWAVRVYQQGTLVGEA